MEEKKPEDSLNVTSEAETSNLNTETLPASEGVVESVPVTEPTLEVADTSVVVAGHSGKNFNFKAYIGGVLAILVIFTGLIFVLEKEGRISTNLFTGVISEMAAIKINDVKITNKEFKSSLEQLSNVSRAEGEDLNDPTVQEALKTETIDTLVNGEILRQAAVEEGLVVKAEDIDARLSLITEKLGGPEALATRMTEFGVTEEDLRLDVENELLIQQLFDLKILATIEVTEEEVKNLYDQAVAGGTPLPPLEQIKEAAIVEIRNGKAQPLISEYIQTLKDAADIEILI